MAYRNFNHLARPYGLSRHRKAQQHAVFTRGWYLFDCKWQDVYDAASKISMYLQGKHKPIFYWDRNIGDHVVAINTKELSLPDDEWRYRMFYHHTRYARGRTWANATELHLNDPTILLYKACYKLCGQTCSHGIHRRYFMNRLHLYPDDKLPPEIRANIFDQIQGTNEVPKSLDEYSQEERENFPKLVDLPDDYMDPLK